MRVFAGPRDEGFYLDLGAVFDLLQLRNLTGNFGQPVDGTAGFNVHAIAFQVPMEQLTRSGARPTNPTDPNAVIGVWSTASRPAVTTRSPGGETHSGTWVQVSRLGNPLVRRHDKPGLAKMRPANETSTLPSPLPRLTPGST